MPERELYRRIIKRQHHLNWDDWEIRPCHREEANRILKAYHRHATRVTGDKNAIKLVDKDGNTLGVGIAARPVNRIIDDGFSLEITRVCLVDGAPKNACSALYGRLCRAAKASGYKRMYTYTLIHEIGTSIKASGFRFNGMVRGRYWPEMKRKHKEKAPDKKRWLRNLV